MGEASKLDFLLALGEEVCGALSPPVPENLIVPQDGYGTWRQAFGSDPSPEALAALGEPELEQLRAVCAGYFECPEVSVEHIRLAVSRTLARWPARPT